MKKEREGCGQVTLAARTNKRKKRNENIERQNTVKGTGICVHARNKWPTRVPTRSACSHWPSSHALMPLFLACEVRVGEYVCICERQRQIRRQTVRGERREGKIQPSHMSDTQQATMFFSVSPAHPNDEVCDVSYFIFKPKHAYQVVHKYLLLPPCATLLKPSVVNHPECSRAGVGGCWKKGSRGSWGGGGGGAEK